MNNPDDPIEAWIGRGPPARAPDPCPDDNRLAGYAEGRLPAAARPALEAHLSRCEACRGLVAAFADGSEGAEEVGGMGEEDAPIAHASSAGPSSDPAPIPSLAAARARAVRSWALAAAVALFALGAGFAIRAWLPASPPAVDGFDATLAAAAADLRAAEPTLLADLRPLTAAERAGAVADTTRSGVRILEPAETVLSPRPPVSWEAVPGATLYVVTFSDARTGAAIASSRTQATRLGPWVGKELLVPGGAYLVEVAASGDLGSQKASRAFQVATADVARDFAAGVAVLERKSRPGQQALLAASLAVRKGLLLEAERILSTAAARGPSDPASATPAHDAVLELRAHVRRRLSWPEAPTGR